MAKPTVTTLQMPHCCGHVDGDPDAFAELVARHQDRMWAIALRIMRNNEDAADALQDAYIAAFRRAASFRGDAQVTSWLHRVVVNACLDRLRSLGCGRPNRCQRILIDRARWASSPRTLWRSRSSAASSPQHWAP